MAAIAPRKNPETVNLMNRAADVFKGARIGALAPGAGSNQQEVDQRNQGRADAGGDQGVIGAEVVLHVE